MSAEIETEDRAQEQARLQAESIAEMVAALNVDYARLEELREERKDLQKALKDAEAAVGPDTSIEVSDAVHEAREELEDWEALNLDELEDLERDAGECQDEDEARQRIEEDPLSVEVRSGWVSQGEEMEADEFQILLCTGGPAVRIVGDLSGGTPTRAWIEYQDWFKPWVQAFNVIEQDTLLAYCSNFFSDGY